MNTRRHATSASTARFGLGLGLAAIPACAAPSVAERCLDAPPPALEASSVGHEVDGPGEPPRVMTGDPLPPGPGVPVRPDEQRWLASDPHVPFFSLRPDDHGYPTILPHEPGDCTRWAVPASRWRSVGRHGEIVGEFELAGGEGYDLTGCYELEFECISGEVGSGLLVSGAYRAPATSLAWSPSAAELGALEARVAEIDGLFDPPAFRGEPLPTLSARTLAFVRVGVDREPEGDSPRWIAVGGPWFGLFSLSPRSAGSAPRWRLRYLDAELAVYGDVPPMAYTPLAAIDADADGDPELVVHRTDGPSWDDLLLIPGGTIYDEGPVSVGGATI